MSMDSNTTTIFASHTIRGHPVVADPLNVTLAFERQTFPKIRSQIQPSCETTVIRQALRAALRLLPQGKHVACAVADDSAILDSLSALIGHSSVDIRRQVSQAFDLIARQEVGRNAIVEHPDAQMSIRVLTRDKDPRVRAQSMDAFRSLSEFQVSRDDLVIRSLVNHFVERARDEPVPAIKAQCLYVLSRCIRTRLKDEEESWKAQTRGNSLAVAANGIQVAVNLLQFELKKSKTSAISDSVRGNAAQVIYALAEPFAVKAKVLETVVIPNLFQLLDTDLTSWSTIGSVCLALSTLLTEKAAKVQALETDRVTNLVTIASKALESYTSTTSTELKTVLLNSIRAIAVLVSHPDAQRIIQNTNIIDLLDQISTAKSHDTLLLRCVDDCRQAVNWSP